MTVYEWYRCMNKTHREQELILTALGDDGRDKLHRWKYHRIVSFILLVYLRHQPDYFTREACVLEPDETGAFLIQELLTTPELLALSVTEEDIRRVVEEGKEYDDCGNVSPYVATCLRLEAPGVALLHGSSGI